MNSPDAAVLQKYASLIESALRSMPAPSAPAPSDQTVAVELGLVLPRTLLGETRGAAADSANLARLGRAGNIDEIIVQDAGGHARPAYLPLLVWSWARAISVSMDQKWPRADEVESLDNVCDRLERIVDRLSLPAGALPANMGDQIGEAACAIMALHIARPLYVDNEPLPKMTNFMAEIAARQQPNGALLLAGRSDNPETHGFHELVLLHALSGYALRSGDKNLTAAVDLAAEFHQNETQPDHATHQPWAITAFLFNPLTQPLADQLLHSAMVKARGPLDGVSLMLLADCLYCLRSQLGLPLANSERR